MMDIKGVLLQWFIIFFDKKTESGAAIFAQSETLAPQNKSAVKNENVSNKELHKSNIRKFKNKMYSSFMDNIRELILMICSS